MKYQDVSGAFHGGPRGFQWDREVSGVAQGVSRTLQGHFKRSQGITWGLRALQEVSEIFRVLKDLSGVLEGPRGLERCTRRCQGCFRGFQRSPRVSGGSRGLWCTSYASEILVIPLKYP